MTPTLLAEQVVNGIILGATYALVAGGLALVYGTMRVLNFAHGEFYMLGGYASYMLMGQLGLPPLLAVPLALLLVFAIGVAAQALLLRPLMRREGWAFSTIAATLGLSIFLQNLALRLWGEQFQSLPYYVEGVVRLGPLRLPGQRVLILAGAVLALGATGALLRYTRFGRAVRAVAQDAEAATVLGVPAPRVHMLVFGLSALLGAFAAALLAPIYAVSPWMGVPLLLKGFVVVVLGGLGSFAGAIVGGFLLGIVEAIGVSLTASEWQDVISFSVLVLVIWVRPWGLFGRPPR